jgi:hypothetical protein
MRGIDLEQFQIQFIRGFPATDEDYLLKYRIKPSAPLVKMIIDRTKHYTAKDHAEKIHNFRRISVALETNGIFVPGYALGNDRSYWLCPFLIPNKDFFREFMQAQGVFCYKTATQICPVEVPEDRVALLGNLPNVRSMFDQAAYLPVNMTVPKEQMDLMIKRVLDIFARYQQLADHFSMQPAIHRPQVQVLALSARQAKL